MHIVDQKDLNIIWSWDEQEKSALDERYGERVNRLLDVVETQLEDQDPPPPEDLKELAGELQAAGEMLSRLSKRCLNNAQKIYTNAVADTEQRQKREENLKKLQQHVGAYVMLSQSSAPEIAGKLLKLERIHGIYGVLRDGDNVYQALIDFLVPARVQVKTPQKQSSK